MSDRDGATHAGNLAGPAIDAVDLFHPFGEYGSRSWLATVDDVRPRYVVEWPNDWPLEHDPVAFAVLLARDAR